MLICARELIAAFIEMNQDLRKVCLFYLIIYRIKVGYKFDKIYRFDLFIILVGYQEGKIFLKSCWVMAF